MWWDPILKQKFGKVNVPNFYSYVSVDWFQKEFNLYEKYLQYPAILTCTNNCLRWWTETRFPQDPDWETCMCHQRWQ
jgi:hypothetical protein